MRSRIIEALMGQGMGLEFPGSAPVRDDNLRFGPTGKKVLVARGKDWESFDPNTVTWLGGICSLMPGESDLLRRRELVFGGIDDLRSWLRSWYPRMDQIHDCVGIPPKACKKLVYVVEDSIWGRRIASWTGLPVAEVVELLREVHMQLGAPAIETWLRYLSGYIGSIEIVYSSQIEAELELAIRIMERQHSKRSKGQERDYAKVRMMYTPIWLEILGLKSGVIAEPMHHLIDVENGIVDTGLFQIGFVPYWSASGPTRLIPLSDTRVTHRGNWQAFQLNVGDDKRAFWTAVNHCFTQKEPLKHDTARLSEIVHADLTRLYGAGLSSA